MKYDIAVFGSAFNPCHAGHLDAINQALTQASRVLAVPVYDHPFGKAMAPFEVRCAITNACLRASELEADRVSVSTIEKNLYAAQPGAVFTYTLLNALSRQNPSSRIAFVIGPDNAAPEVWQSFYRADDIVKRWGIIVTQERINIRSTTLRNYFNQGLGIDTNLLCTEAQHLINENNLYQDGQHAA